VGAFSHKLTIAPSCETTDRIGKKLGGAKTGRSSSITMPSMVGILDRAPAVDKKVWCFLSVCKFFVTLWYDEVCDNGNAMKQYNFQNNYVVIA